jgi:hypothetical protein
VFHFSIDSLQNLTILLFTPTNSIDYYYYYYYYYYYFGQEREELCRAQKYDFQIYVSVDRDVETSGVSTVEELCDASGSTRSVEEKNKEGENEEDMVPSFAETYEAVEKVRVFSYAHSVTDADRERLLGLEKLYFQLRQNSAMKQKTMYDFFR